MKLILSDFPVKGLDILILVWSFKAVKPQTSLTLKCIQNCRYGNVLVLICSPRYWTAFVYLFKLLWGAIIQTPLHFWRILFHMWESFLFAKNSTRCPKKILFRNVAEFLLRGVWAVNIWVFWGGWAHLCHIQVSSTCPKCVST